MTVYGTRPEAIKVAPIIKALEESDNFESIPVVTSQHREMLDSVNKLFGIEPVRDLNIMSAKQGLNGIVAKVIKGLDAVYAEFEPDAVIVQGDTSTVMGAAIAAFNRQIPVVHVEAGLRSGDINSPFPEEANRKLTSQISKLHLAPTSTSKANLLREALPEKEIVVTGNSVIDALLEVVEKPVEFTDQTVAELVAQKDDAPIVLVTTHRRENLGSQCRILAVLLLLWQVSTQVTVSCSLPIRIRWCVRVSSLILRDYRTFSLLSPLLMRSSLMLLRHLVLCSLTQAGFRKRPQAWVSQCL